MAANERLYDGDTFAQGKIRVTFPPDQDHGAPWEEHDGHGIVSEWTTRDKAAGERVLCVDRHSRRYYDVAGTLKIARADSWGAPGGRRPGETRRAELARAVEADYEYLRGWCTDQWSYVGVVVTWVDSDGGHDLGLTESLWGVESSEESYLEEGARELADELLARIEVDEPDVVRSEEKPC
jgi:hypothetical protein